MIPGEIFTGFAEFHGIVSVNDFRNPLGFQELLQVSHPFGGLVLHHDCISVIVSRFAIVTEDLVICCFQVTKFSARGKNSPLRLLHGALVILVFLQISQFRSLGK